MAYLNLTFEQFKAAIDMYLMSRYGLDSDMIPDYDYYLAWSNGATPNATARFAMIRARTF